MPSSSLHDRRVRQLQPTAAVIGDAQKAVDGEDALDDREAEAVSEFPDEEDHSRQKRHDRGGGERRLSFCHGCFPTFCGGVPLFVLAW